MLEGNSHVSSTHLQVFQLFYFWMCLPTPPPSCFPSLNKEHARSLALSHLSRPQCSYCKLEDGSPLLPLVDLCSPSSVSLRM